MALVLEKQGVGGGQQRQAGHKDEPGGGHWRAEEMIGAPGKGAANDIDGARTDGQGNLGKG